MNKFVKIKENINNEIKQQGLLKDKYSSDIICPFCKDEGFDMIGLKYHLQKYCIPYANTEKTFNMKLKEDWYEIKRRLVLGRYKE